MKALEAELALDEWVDVRSQHSRMFSNPQGAARHTAFHLEQLRLALSQILVGQKFESPLPTDMFLFKNEKSFRPYQPLPDGKPEKLIAILRGSEFRNVIAMLSERSRERTRELASEQYLRLLLTLRLLFRTPT